MDVGTIIWNELMAASFWLQVDDRATRARLGWAAPIAAEAGLIATARSIATNQRTGAGRRRFQ